MKIFLNMASNPEAVIEEFDYIKIKYSVSQKVDKKDHHKVREAHARKKIFQHLTTNSKYSSFCN